MITHLLDTNICIDVINARPAGVLARFRQQRLGDIGISGITAAELAFGAAKSGSARNREALKMFLAPLEVAPFDAGAIWHYGATRADLERRGQLIGALGHDDHCPCPGIGRHSGHQQHPRIRPGAGLAAGKLGDGLTQGIRGRRSRAPYPFSGGSMAKYEQKVPDPSVKWSVFAMKNENMACTQAPARGME